MPRTFLTSREVAELLDYDNPDQFYRHRQRLIEDHHFPEPVPLSLREHKWRADEVERWIENHGLPRVAGDPTGPNVVLFREARRA